MSIMPEWYSEFRNPILLLQSLLCISIFVYPLQRRSHFWLRLLGSAFLGSVICYYGQLIWNDDNTITGSLCRAATVLITVLMIVAIVFFCHKESLRTALFISCSGYIVRDFATCLKNLFVSLLRINGAEVLPSLYVVFEFLLYIMVLTILYFVFRPMVSQRLVDFNDKYKVIFSVVILLLCIGMARLTYDNPKKDDLMLLATTIYQIVCDLLVLLLQYSVIDRTWLVQSVDTMGELLHEQHTQYEARKENTQILNEKYHDLKHLLKSFGGQLPTKEFEQLKELVERYESRMQTGNDVLDVLLTEKYLVCEQKKITLTYMVDKVDLDFVDKLDLYKLFANALINAIEAVDKLQDGQERFIILNVRQHGNLISIHMENPCIDTIEIENGLPKSQKDPHYHGFGMKSMQRIAERYGGSISVEQRDGRFYLDVLLSAPAK